MTFSLPFLILVIAAVFYVCALLLWTQNRSERILCFPMAMVFSATALVGYSAETDLAGMAASAMLFLVSAGMSLVLSTAHPNQS
jgi:uncharacterized membrane protein